MKVAVVAVVRVVEEVRLEQVVWSQTVVTWPPGGPSRSSIANPVAAVRNMTIEAITRSLVLRIGGVFQSASRLKRLQKVHALAGLVPSLSLNPPSCSIVCR